MAEPLDIAAIQAQLRQFVGEREWDRFHTPKNLVMALSGEVGELTELFQWLSEEESWRIMDAAESAQAVRDEIADVLMYLLRIADVLGVDPAPAVQAKMRKNAAKYPVEHWRGKARKYTEPDRSS
ncbi:MAG: nucleotide pyrophosphohydrolase [Proteobacteria bacterium]|nr:nucleotide pyrophosphohydrolase [Pseudomonadota bacterium]